VGDNRSRERIGGSCSFWISLVCGWAYLSPFLPGIDLWSVSVVGYTNPYGAHTRLSLPCLGQASRPVCHQLFEGVETVGCFPRGLIRELQFTTAGHLNGAAAPRPQDGMGTPLPGIFSLAIWFGWLPFHHSPFLSNGQKSGRFLQARPHVRYIFCRDVVEPSQAPRHQGACQLPH
jgi:hypothetical protein